MPDTKKVSSNASGADSKGAMEDEVQRISEIHGSEVLGHEGEAREEHTGQNSPRPEPDATEDLADNEPEDLPES